MRRTSRNNPRRFLVLILIVLVLGVILQTQGDLINPLQSTTMLISMSSGDAGFAMVGDEQPREEAVASAPVTADTQAQEAEANTVAAPTGTMTMEAFTAELAAAGVDVEAVSASMSAEGRSLENLLVVVNSGRVTVVDLAARLTGESAMSVEAAPTPESTSLLDIHWEEIGSVLFDLWFILVVTAAIIVLARPANWLRNQLRRITTA